MLQGGIALQPPIQNPTDAVGPLVPPANSNPAGTASQAETTRDPYRVRLPGAEKLLQDLSIDFSYAENARQPIDLKLSSGQSHFGLKGSVDTRDASPQLSLKADFDLKLNDLSQLLSAQLPPSAAQLSGSVKGHITADGALFDPAATVRIEADNLCAWKVPLGHMVLKAELMQRQVSLSAMHLRSDWGEADLSGSFDLRRIYPQSFQQAAAGIDSLLYALSFAGRNLDPGRLPMLTFPPGGLWQAEARIDGQGIPGPRTSGQVAGRVNAADVHLVPDAKATDGQVTFDIGWADGLLDFKKIDGHLGANKLQAGGRMMWSGKSIEAHANLQLQRLAELGAVLATRLPSGRAALELEGKGDLRHPDLRVALVADELALDDWHFGHLSADAALGPDGILRFSRLLLEHQGSKVDGKAQIHLLQPNGSLQDDPVLSASLRLNAVKLNDFRTLADAGAILNGRLEAGGSLQHLSGDLILEQSRIDLRDLQAAVEGVIRWRDGLLDVPRLNLARNDSRLQIQGRVRWREKVSGRWTNDPVVQAGIQSEALYPADFLKKMKAQGAFALKAELRGRFSDLQGNYHLHGRNLELTGQKFEAISAVGRFAEKRFYADRLVLALGPRQEFRAKGWYGLDGRFDAHLDGEAVQLKRIDALQQIYAIQGDLGLHLSAGGSIQQPTVSGNLEIHKPRLGDQTWDDFHARFQLRDQLLAVDAALNFTLAARYHLEKGDFDLSADFQQTDLAPYLALMADSRWAGSLSGKIQASGNRSNLSGIRAQAQLTSTRLIYQRTTLLSFDRLAATLRDGQLEIAPTRLQMLADGHLDLVAGGNIDRDLSLRLDGVLPLAALAPFTDALTDTAGNINIALRGDGQWQQMKWRADLDLKKIGFVATDLGQAVHDLNGSIQLTPQQATVAGLSGMLDDGRFSLDGQMRLIDWRPDQGELRLKLQSLPLQVPDTMDLLLNADLVLKGNSAKSMLEGEITLLEGSYYKDVGFNLMSSITQVKRSGPPPAAWSAPPWFASVGLNVTLKYRYPFLVDNNMARLEITPDFAVAGTAAKPVVNGRATISEGEIFFRRHTFTVKKGTLDFNNPHKTEPTLDLTAESQFKQWLITLHATGTPDNLAIRLSSDPPESDSDILSLILLGRKSSELTQGGGGATNQQMLASLAASAWGENIKKKAGVDILEVETGATNEDDNEDRIQVTVGKKVSPRMTLKYSVETSSGEVIQRATSEYQLLEHLSASGFQDTSGIYGGELIFRIRFQ